MVLAKQKERIGMLGTVMISRSVAAIALVIALHFTPTDAACEPGPATSSSELADAGAALSSALGKPSPAPAASTPGAERVGHLHHLGAKQFYLDRAKALALTEEQQTKLRRLWEFDQVEKARFRNTLTITERELWRLTGAEEPSLPAIEASVRAVEKLKSDYRISFIRRVMGAAAVLTVHQREMLRMAKATR